MIRGSLPRRYARALMAIGQERNIAERLGQELDQVARLAAEEEAFRVAIRIPIIDKKARERIIEALCQAIGAHEVMLHFLKLLNDKGRLGFLEQIAEAYRELADEVAGRVRAEVISAQPLSPESEARIKEVLARLTGKEVIMAVEVDESLIGGIVARVAGKLLDGSLKTQLASIEEILKTGAEL